MMLQGGRAYYGYSIGVLLFDGRRYPMAPGDVGNASSYGFPVRLKVVPGLLNCPLPPQSGDAAQPPHEVELLIAAARELEAEGVRAIVTCCGFFSVVQDALAQAVRIPVFTSPLLLVPLLQRMLGGREIGILTASKGLLVEGYLRAAGITPDHRVAIAGLEASSEFYATHMGGTRTEMDLDKLRAEVVAIAVQLVQERPGLAAIVLECTTLPTFAADIEAATGLPVFDYIAFVEFIHRSVLPRRYAGLA
jgi:Asp/Glu/hydantoin racemase